MALADYATLAEIKASLELTGETFADADISLALTAASRAVEKACNRRFWLDDDNTQVRYYTPDAVDSLKVDDLVVLTSLTTDSDGNGTFENFWTENTDFVLNPINAEADNMPWTTIEVHPYGAYRFTSGLPRSVKVIGQFGWLDVPSAVKSATMMLTARLVKRAREAPFGVAGFGMDGAVVSISRNDPDVAALLKPYMRQRVVVA